MFKNISKKDIASIAIFLITVIASFFMFKKEVVQVYSWYFTLLLLGIGFFPVVSIIFKNFEDNGFQMAKPFGLLISAALFYWLNTLKILKFTSIFIVLFVIVLIALVYIFFFKKTKINNFKLILNEELIFFVVFILLCFMHSFFPNISETEKFMDFGFMKSMSIATYFPVDDFWFTGKTLNYYYYGQYISTFLTKLSFNTVEYGYNLMIITLYSVSTLVIFSLVYNCAKSFTKKNAAFAGIISSVYTMFAGNLHYVIYRFFVYRNAYYYPNSSRFIGYEPDIADKTITEFPSYSFFVSDLHAHVINMMFVILFVSVLYAFLSNEESLKRYKKVINIYTVSLGIILGTFAGTNYWDYPIYIVVFSLAAVFLAIRNKTKFFVPPLQIGFVLLLSKIIIYPFEKYFVKMMSGIGICDRHSAIWQIFVLYGLQLVVCIVGIIVSIVKEKGFFKFFKNASINTLFMALISCCGFGLILTPELVYVKDIYGDAFQRCNTMFKTSYQVYLLLGIATGYYIVYLLRGKKWQQIIACVATGIVFVSTLYFVNAFATRSGFSIQLDMVNGVETGRELIFANGKTTLNATSFLYDKENPSVYGTSINADGKLIEYINENIPTDAVVLEAAGLSYTPFERISVFTGRSTIVGWHTHEHLWRNDETAVLSREGAVNDIYKKQDASLVEKYGVDYIVWGSTERQKYSNVVLYKLYNKSEVVYSYTQDDYTYYIFKPNFSPSED